ncbi:MAG TPA: hypothetical protein VEW05_12375 [Candidatus Polarisedimenticolia bacterium]|nr:hypothetical protein [Candidatus Polarisedimenticolia bacterium]
MKKLAHVATAIALAAAVGFAGPRSGKAQQDGTVFVGDISDSLCGLKHSMEDARRCTLGCVKGFDGTTFVLADHEHQKVYNLSNQGKAKAFAGEKVEVRGTLIGDTIRVISIKAAH